MTGDTTTPVDCEREVVVVSATLPSGLRGLTACDGRRVVVFVEASLADAERADVVSRELRSLR